MNNFLWVPGRLLFECLSQWHPLTISTVLKSIFLNVTTSRTAWPTPVQHPWFNDSTRKKNKNNFLDNLSPQHKKVTTCVTEMGSVDFLWDRMHIFIQVTSILRKRRNMRATSREFNPAPLTLLLRQNKPRVEWMNPRIDRLIDCSNH